MRRGTFLLLAAATLAAGCTDDLFTGPEDSGGDFDVSAGAGARPSYTWSAGPAFTIAVVRTASPTVVVWRIADVNSSDIRSPVTHGTVPSGAIETAAGEKTLTAGIRYRVTVTLADGRSAWREFTA